MPDQEERPSDQSEPGHPPRDEAGLVHQIAEDQPVPKGDDESGAEQERPVLELRERDGEVGRIRGVLAQAHDPEHEDDPGGEEDALDDPGGDVADGEDLALPPRDRVEDDGRSDVREDEKKLQEGPQVNLVVLPATSDVRGRVVKNGLEESQRRDRRHERDEEQHTEDTRSPLICAHRKDPFPEKQRPRFSRVSPNDSRETVRLAGLDAGKEAHPAPFFTASAPRSSEPTGDALRL